MCQLSGISPKDCSIIGGCFKAGLGCFYPARLHHVKVRSGEDPYRSSSPSGRDIFGQPICLPLNKHSSPGDFLSSYHHCLQSGCVVDSSITYQFLYQQLINVTLTVVPEHLRQRFYELVVEGIVSADNWEYHLKKLQAEAHLPNYGFPKPGGNTIDILAYTLALGTARNATRRRAYHQNPTTNGFPSNPIGFPSNPHSNPLGGFQVGPPFNNQFSPQGIPGSNPMFSSPQLPECPYHNYNIGSFFPLKGSFAGCCEQSLCYIPRQQLAQQYSGIAPYLSHWQKWSQCSATCGGGQRTRVRRCVSYKLETCGSLSDVTQTEVCNNDPCPYYGAWGAWGLCNAACGGGSQTRVRLCQPAGSVCSGEAEERRYCRTGSCPVLSQWTQFGECSVTCGVGERSRTRKCTDGGVYGCEAATEPLEETVQCQIFCGQAEEVASTACEYPLCKVTKQYRCVYQGGKGHCRDFKPSITTRCYEGYCGYFGK